MTISAGIGIANFPFEDARGFWRWVDLCEAGGVDSIWQSDRLISREANLECMSVMAALAGATKRIKFGMNVASLGLRDPVLTAKQCATIDVLSDGRLLPAFGLGSTRSRDYTATGIATRRRGKRMDEAMQIMSRLWVEEAVTFAGEHFRLDSASISPRPVQSPLPLWVGGSAKQAIERTARWGTGWQAGIASAGDVGPVVRAIKARALELGRSIDEDHFGAGFGFRFGSPDEPFMRRYIDGFTRSMGQPPDAFTAVGGVEEIMRLLRGFHSAGAHKFILRPIANGADEMMGQTRRLIEEVLPEVAALN
ncbi:MAG: LLM class flavin-dependent oxidoreductase [Gammaproteobacteria bacterium]|nr:LLM class flavin-dependent oxidoreductase [Gammaproteobacteria bacterium]